MSGCGFISGLVEEANSRQFLFMMGGVCSGQLMPDSDLDRFSVLGGDAHIILLMFLQQFSRPVMWANLLAWPLALWGMLRWLQRFPYQVEAGKVAER